MKRAASASWNVPPSEAWDVPDAAIDNEADDPVVPPGQHLVNELLEMYATEVLPATRLRSLCHWAMMAGVEEAVPYALCTKTSGHAQRKLDQALGFGSLDQSLYNDLAPMLSHVDDEREQALIAMMPPHESLLREVADHPDAASSWSVQMTDDQWIGAYNDHPVVKAANLEERRTILPLALYMDATAVPNATPWWCSRFTSWPQGDDTWHSQCASRNFVTADAGAGTRCTSCTLASIGRWLPCPKAQCPRHATTKHRGVLKTSNARRYKASRWD